MTTIRRWTPEEDARLTWAWEKHGPRELARTFGRSPIALYHRATKLGLGNGAPRGAETIEQAARRCGVMPRTLRLAMDLAGVTARRMRVNPYVKRRHPRRRWLWPEDADRAIALWCRLETITAAAERLGMSRFALDRILEARGQRVACGRRWLVAPEHADAVFATGTWRRHARGAVAALESRA